MHDYTDNKFAAQRFRINARTIALTAVRDYDSDHASVADYRERLQAAIASLEIARALEAGEI